MDDTNNSFYHALTIDHDICTGCTHCMKACPTEAIRIRNGKSVIDKNKCIDCGECFKACSYHAIYIKQDDFDLMDQYKYKVALVPATFIGQFASDVSTSQIYACLKQIGFTHIYEIEHGVSFLIDLYKKYMAEHKDINTFISPYCPAVVRLIQTRFPSLVKNIIHMKVPLDITSLMIREYLSREGINSEDVGVFYVSPCAAKIAAVKSPVGEDSSAIAGVINMDFLYNKVQHQLSKKAQGESEPIANHSLSGKDILWELTGGESVNFDNSSFAVDGMKNVIEFLEKIEDDDIEVNGLVEMRVCDQSCVGGILCPNNRFLAKQKLEMRAQEIKQHIENKDYKAENLFSQEEFDEKIAPMMNIPYIAPRSSFKLHDNLQIALKMVENIKNIESKLPGLDCSACGAPTCSALAEDIIKEEATIDNCLFSHLPLEKYEEILKKIWGKNIKPL